MTSCDLDTSVPDWIIVHHETLAVLQELGIEGPFLAVVSKFDVWHVVGNGSFLFRHREYLHQRLHQIQETIGNKGPLLTLNVSLIAFYV